MQNSLKPVSAGNIPDEVNVIIEIPKFLNALDLRLPLKPLPLYHCFFLKTPS
jgi:inorganic pyrophosphatase